MVRLQHCIYRHIFFLLCIALPVPGLAQNVDADLEHTSEKHNKPIVAEMTKVETATPDVVKTPVQSDSLAAPKKSTGQVMTPAHLLGQVFIGLLFVTSLILLLAWLARRMGYQQFAGGQTMHVVAQLPLGNREKAVLIKVAGQHMLLGVAPGRVSFLSHLENLPAVDVLESSQGVPIKKGQEFARYLKSILVQGNKS